jgi:hypothetical protein
MLSGKQRLLWIEGHGWQLFPNQRKILGSDKPRNGLAGGIGYGKSLVGSLFLYGEIMGNLGKEDRLYWIGSQDFKNTHYIFMPLVNEIKKNHGRDWNKYLWVSTPKDRAWELRYMRNTVITVSWNNPNSLQGASLNGLVVDETGLMDESIWQYGVGDRLTKVEGSWALFVGTWEEAGTFFKALYELAQIERDRWNFACAPSWENTALYPGGREDKKIVDWEKEVPPEIFEERYGAIPQKPSGLVYPEFNFEHHVGDYPFTPGDPVYLWVDPGTTVYAVAVIQPLGRGRLKQVDEIYIRGASTEEVIAEAVKRPWWRQVQTGAIDDKAPEAQMGWQDSAVYDKMSKLLGRPLRGIFLQKQSIPIKAGIDRVKTFLFSITDDETAEHRFKHLGKWGVPRLFVNGEQCPSTIHEAVSYKYGKGEKDTPMKKNDHMMNAWAYGLVNQYGFVEFERRKPGKLPDRFRDI